MTIVRFSGRILRCAVLATEAAHVASGGTPRLDASTPETDWKAYIAQLAANLTQKQFLQQLVSRKRIYEHPYELRAAGDVIRKTPVKESLKTLGNVMKRGGGEVGSYEHWMSCAVESSKEIFHLKAFM